jgi:hypothetical protein
METERNALSQPERDRLKVLHEVKQEHLTQEEAARRLKVTEGMWVSYSVFVAPGF